MKYTAQDESPVANIRSTRRSRVLYLSRDSHQELYILCKRSGSVLLCVLLYFTLTKVSTKHSSLVILTHLLNKQIVFFDKMCQ